MARTIFAAMFSVAACSAHGPAGPPDAPALDPVYRDVAAAVSHDALLASLTADAHERYTPEGKAAFRAAWTADMQALGLDVTELDYTGGIDLEAVMPGRSSDSIVIVVHYDSTGAVGLEADNPGADDDMTGMSIELETARVLAPYAGRLEHTVRFVATDQEEDHTLAGARAYASALGAKAQAEGFRIVAAVDDEQTGWNCTSEGLCNPPAPSWPAFDVDDCDGTGRFDFPDLGDRFEDVVHATSSLAVVRGCFGDGSDHYAMWEAGVPAIVFTEHAALANPHFDQFGDDRLATVDGAYLTAIAGPAIAFQANLIGISP